MASYRAQRLDPDVTDDDMLYLRAYLEDLKVLRPDPHEVLPKLERFEALFEQFKRRLTKEGLTVAKIMAMVEDANEVKHAAVACTRAFESQLSFTDKLEARHHALIKASKTRAEVRIKNKAALELEQFQALMKRMLMIIEANTPPEFYWTLVKVLQKGMEDVPVRMLASKTIDVGR